jgi:hypothetical protein
MSKGKYSMSRA